MIAVINRIVESPELRANLGFSAGENVRKQVEEEVKQAYRQLLQQKLIRVARYRYSGGVRFAV